jgi:hypothetical protein
VIVLSAWNAEATRKELGAEGLLDKPCDPTALKNLLESVLLRVND